MTSFISGLKHSVFWPRRRALHVSGQTLCSSSVVMLYVVPWFWLNNFCPHCTIARYLKTLIWTVALVGLLCKQSVLCDVPAITSGEDTWDTILLTKMQVTLEVSLTCNFKNFYGVVAYDCVVLRCVAASHPVWTRLHAASWTYHDLDWLTVCRSGSSFGQALALMKHSIKSLIDTLGDNDFVNVANVRCQRQQSSSSFS